MSIAAEAALIDVLALHRRTHAEMQRSLAQGRCAECDMPVKPNGRARRTCLCEACQQTLAWCSACQRPKDRSMFARDRRSPNGLNGECRSCRRARKVAGRSAPRCARKGCGHEAAQARKGNYHKLCAECLTTHAWCSDCERARLRREFTREVRIHRRHAAICRACERARRPATGAKAAKSATARERYKAIRAYALAHPTAEKAAIARALGVSLNQIREAMQQLGFTIGHGPKRATALERYRAVANLAPAEIAAREGLSYNAAAQLRCRARKALARAGDTGS